MRTIAIIGMGLIGASLGMALRSADEEQAVLGPTVIVGYDRDPSATARARGRLAIDRQARTLAEALHEADLVVVAVPPLAARELFSQMAPLLPHGAVVTDTISTKVEVLAWAHELLPRTVDFVGGHPMAGKEQSGAEAADRDLLRGAVYCLTPDAQPAALQLVEAMVRQAGAKPYYLDALEHDSFVAGVSHLPFLLSAALVEVTSNSSSWREMSPLAATGFHDLTRLASGDPAMHRDICLTNADALIRWVDATSEWLATLREQLSTRDAEALGAMFEHARQEREQWLLARPNQRPGEGEFVNPTGVQPERRNIFSFGGGRRKK
ncbi:MAG: prephenate dehydrogenase/arogenate dehydrogenase family protein [Roseiflexaceae bacterium]|nr:prephenate dehydrogenase/arogenate dehydrogenase family protein [Roseiflexaceae bacterium]